MSTPAHSGGEPPLALRMALTVGIGTVLVVLSAGLPGHGFFSGDSGVKLIAARNAIAHPTRPFQIDLPVIGSERVPLMERFFTVHNDHAHALQSPLFPVLAAPAIAWFGTRGAYLLPGVSFLMLLPLLDVVRRRYASNLPWGVLAVSVLLLNPLLFYALEFWEHAPAVAFAAAATALVVATPPPRTITTRMIGAGLCAAVAVLLRPEAIWYAGGLGVIAMRARGGIPYLSGLAGPGVLFMVANYLESGNPAGAHAAANLAPLAADWTSSHWHRFRLWLAPDSPIAVVGATIIIGAWVARWWGIGVRLTQSVALVGVAAVAVAAAMGSFGRDSLWHAWPVGTLVFIPIRNAQQSADLRFLAVVAVVGILISSTHDGGAQWGPRFLMIALPALLVLASISAWDAVQSGRIRSFNGAALLLILVAGLWTTRSAYREIRGAKSYYADLVDSVAERVRPGSYILSNVWWFDQVTADLYGTRTFLFTDTPSTATDTLRRLSEGGIQEAALVWTEESDGESLSSALRETCFREIDRYAIEERRLTIVVATCEHHDR